jgi:hypothetical protein
LLLGAAPEKDGRPQRSREVDDCLCWRLAPRFLCFDSDELKCDGSGASPSLLSSEEEEEEISCTRGGGMRLSAESSANRVFRPPNSFCLGAFRSSV